jgi:hypothetical protein
LGFWPGFWLLTVFLLSRYECRRYPGGWGLAVKIMEFTL